MQKDNDFIVPTVCLDEKRKVVMIHKDYALFGLLLDRPLRNEFSIKALDVTSFCNLVNEYKQENSKLFYSDSGIECVVNFNTKDNSEFCNKQIELDLKYTPFYKNFSGSLEKSLNQRDFIIFLKSLFKFVTKIDGAKNDNMDVIELAESLQAVKKFDSFQSNSSSKFCIDIEIKSGAKQTLQLPKKLTFEMPIYEADLSILGVFDTELFVNIDNEGNFSLKLSCYNEVAEQREALNKLATNISKQCNDVKAFKATV